MTASPVTRCVVRSKSRRWLERSELLDLIQPYGSHIGVVILTDARVAQYGELPPDWASHSLLRVFSRHHHRGALRFSDTVVEVDPEVFLKEADRRGLAGYQVLGRNAFSAWIRLGYIAAKNDPISRAQRQLYGAGATTEDD